MFKLMASKNNSISEVLGTLRLLGILLAARVFLANRWPPGFSMPSWPNDDSLAYPPPPNSSGPSSPFVDFLATCCAHRGSALRLFRALLTTLWSSGHLAPSQLLDALLDVRRSLCQSVSYQPLLEIKSPAASARAFWLGRCSFYSSWPLAGVDPGYFFRIYVGFMLREVRKVVTKLLGVFELSTKDFRTHSRFAPAVWLTMQLKQKTPIYFP